MIFYVLPTRPRGLLGFLFLFFRKTWEIDTHTHTHTNTFFTNITHTHTHRHFENSHRRHTETNAHRLFDYFKNKTRRRKRRSRRRYRPEWHPSMALKIFYPQVASQISVRCCWDYRPCCHYSSAVEEPWRCCRSSSSWRFFGSFFLSFMKRMKS